MGIVLFILSLSMLYITPLNGVKPSELEATIVMCTGILCIAIGESNGDG